MLRKVLNSSGRCSFSFLRYYSSKTNEQVSVKLVNSLEIANEENVVPSVLDDCKEDISHVAPYLRPTFNFAAYVNKSETLKQLVHLGVDLSKIEKIRDAPPFMLQLDFEKDIKQYIIFFHDLGLDTDKIAEIITKNPFVLKQELSDLQVRVDYLKSKKFTNEMIQRIAEANPFWFTNSVQEIDKNLGFFQKTFSLTGNEIRQLVTKKPRLITYSMKHIRLNLFVIKEEMGLTAVEQKQVLLDTPGVFMKEQNFLLKTFEYLHKTMKIPIEAIVQSPRILTCREFRLKQRHQFLQKLGKTQFDPKKPNYISLLALVSGSDSQFSTEIAGSTIQAYNAFLKTV